MSIEVSAGEHGVVRVFSLGYRVSMELKHFEAVDTLAAALGVERLNPEDVQIVDLAALRDMGLPAFLMEGYGIAESELSPLSDMLNALSGHIAIVRSGAFAGAAVHLLDTAKDGHQVKLVATVHEPRMSAPQPMPAFESAVGDSAGSKKRKPPSDKAMSGRVAMYALLFVFAFTIVFVWIAS